MKRFILLLLTLRMSSKSGLQSHRIKYYGCFMDFQIILSIQLFLFSIAGHGFWAINLSNFGMLSIYPDYYTSTINEFTLTKNNK
jgi:membrane glycosyltransferase